MHACHSSFLLVDVVVASVVCESALADFFFIVRFRAPFGAIAIKLNPRLKLKLKLPFESSGTRCESAHQTFNLFLSFTKHLRGHALNTGLSIAHNGRKDQLLGKYPLKSSYLARRWTF